MVEEMYIFWFMRFNIIQGIINHKEFIKMYRRKSYGGVMTSKVKK